MQIVKLNDLILILTFWCCMTLAACGGQTPTTESLQEPLLEGFKRDTLMIEKSSGERVEFAVYVAKTDEQMRQGLMFVRKLDQQTGMLFQYKRNREASMWMKNTFIPLDIIFIRNDGVISNIEQNTVPKSLKSIKADGLVKGTLELSAGSAKNLGLKAGDTVIHQHFRNN